MNSSEPAVRVVFASCSPGQVDALVRRFAEIAPELELLVVSEVPPPVGLWIPWRPDRASADHLGRVRAALRDRTIAFGAVMLGAPPRYSPLKRMGLQLTGSLRTLFYNENLDHFTLRRPAGIQAALRHVWRDIRNQRKIRLTQFAALRGGRRGEELRRARTPGAAELSLGPKLPEGVSVVIPSRNGLLLLQRLLPLIVPQAAEVIVVDNGSDDGSASWLAERFPGVRVEVSADPLSFARAVNRGIAAARFSHVCLLNNDMVVEPDFLAALRQAFDCVPDLFCATAQIFFPAGRRRQETGKAVIHLALEGDCRDTAFPVRCVEPLPGEDLTWVLYGSGGCSLYDSARLRALGGFDEAYDPAYVEDLDLGVRGWQRGWPSVFVAGARTIHDHRSTTSRYYTEAELACVLERNYLRFIARAVQGPDVFRRLWRDAVDRLSLRAVFDNDPAARAVLPEAAALAASGPAYPLLCDPHDEQLVFALGSGDVAVFPGRARRTGSAVLVATCQTPGPASHGVAGRMYNLMRRAAADYTQALLTFVDELHTPAHELLEICAEVVQVRRSSVRLQEQDSGRPDLVDDFDSPAFRAALRQLVRRWDPAVVQLEFTQMAQYAAECGLRARTVLVEHDHHGDLQVERWTRFRRAAYEAVDCVVTTSVRDQRSVEGAKFAVTIGNGVDLRRFQPAPESEMEAGRVLFVASFEHLPDLLALDSFLNEVWPKIADLRPALHVVAGPGYAQFHQRWRDHVHFRLDGSIPGLEIGECAGDVWQAYRRAAVVIAPLLVPSGSNLRMMEAMAMGKAIVATPAGVSGLADDLSPGQDILVASDAGAFADAIRLALTDAERRRVLGARARAAAERLYDWDRIAERQHELYERLIRG